MDKVHIGSNYYPNRTLRQMPRHWVLEETRRRWRWWKDGNFVLGLSTCLIILLILAQVLR